MLWHAGACWVTVRPRGLREAEVPMPPCGRLVARGNDLCSTATTSSDCDNWPQGDSSPACNLRACDLSSCAMACRHTPG